jgi:hypothetical protein
MRNLSKFTILGAVLVVATAFASADTVQLGSYRTSQPARGNQNHAMGFAGSRGNTFDIGIGGMWTAAAPHSSWVSQNVGDCPGCGNVEPNGTYTFQTSFSLSNADDSGSIFVMADDTTDVLLNGHLLQTFSGGPNSTCTTRSPIAPFLCWSLFHLATWRMVRTIRPSTFTRQRAAPRDGILWIGFESSRAQHAVLAGNRTDRVCWSHVPQNADVRRIL